MTTQLLFTLGPWAHITGIDNNCDGVIEDEEHHSCPGDFNFDDSRDVMDLLDILGAYGCSGPGCSM